MDKITPQENKSQEELDGLRPAEAAQYIEKDEEALHPAGTFVEYKEDDQIMICRVLENSCDKEWLRYKLEVVKQYHGHFLCKDPEVGKVFDVSSNRKYCISGMWGVWHVGTYCDGKFIMAAMQEAKPWAGKAVAA